MTALPAGTYELSAAYTPTDATLFTPSTSAQPLVVQVLEPGTATSTTTALSVQPAGRSVADQPVMLEAAIAPADYGSGTVHFFDGDTPIGTAPATSGRSGLAYWDLGVGEHDLKAVFVSSSALIAGSASEAVAHTVVPPPADTSTSLVVSPDGPSDQGDEVTLTATVDPDDAAGEVVFATAAGELGRDQVSDGGPSSR